MNRAERMEALARRHIPNFRIAVKADVLWMRALGMVLWPLVPDFGSAFTTVIGSTVYLPRPKEAFSPDGLAATLAHELVHQLDQREFGLAFYTSYLLTPLPVGRTTRAHWERRAYAVDLMLALERGGPECLAETLDRLVALFSGPSYAWMWAGKESARAYLAPLVAEVESGALQKRAPYDEILATWLAGA